MTPGYLGISSILWGTRRGPFFRVLCASSIVTSFVKVIKSTVLIRASEVQEEETDQSGRAHPPLFAPIERIPRPLAILRDFEFANLNAGSLWRRAAIFYLIFGWRKESPTSCARFAS